MPKASGCSTSVNVRSDVAHFIGAHARDNGGIDQAVKRAASAQMSALQVFSAVPKYYNEKVTVKPERAARFRDALAAAGIAPGNVVVHAGYVLNTASPEPDKAEKAAAALAKELERTTALGAVGCCFHPGSALTGDVDSALARAGDAVVRAVEAVPSGARVLIENTAGAGKTVGRTPAEIAAMLARVPAALRGRAGYGLDTCHLYAAGHDIASSPDAQRAVIDAFVDAAGELPAFIHLNDSEGAFGSNRDRHALIGEGAIGVAPFGWLLADARSHDIPLILETPQSNVEIPDDDTRADEWDVRMMALLRGLIS
jgi:deoxyribonuclease-4